MSDCTPITACLVCGGTELKTFFDLGEQPLANDFRTSPGDLPKYPLALNRCLDCNHGQLTHGVDPKILFKDYPYVSGTSETLRQYMKGFAEKVTAGRKLLKVLDIGGNDGTLANEFEALGAIATIVDPADTLTIEGVDVNVAFWGRECAAVCKKIGPFDIIIAMNVLPHAENPVEFLTLCHEVLAPGGKIYVQTSQARYLVDGQFDCVYHEHRSYFSMKSMATLAWRCGFHINSAEIVPIHGGSYLLEMESGFRNPLVPPLEEEERRLGYGDDAIYERFAAMAEHVKEQVKTIVDYYYQNGDFIVAYGAAAKGMTFLNYTGIMPHAIVDDAPLKQGKWPPLLDNRMTLLQVTPYERLARVRSLFLILAWNFASEIKAKVRAARNNPNDRFLVCFPEINVTGLTEGPIPREMIIDP